MYSPKGHNKSMLRKGFTLIEMLIVLAVIGVLAATVAVMINPVDQIRKSNDAKRKTGLEQLQRSLELYYQDNGRYPASSADYKIYIGSTALAWGAAWQPYMSKLPSDPIPGRTFIYYVPATANGQTYYLYTSLERGAKDPQVCNNGSACTSITTGGAGFPTATACGATCNYGISSPNVAP